MLLAHILTRTWKLLVGARSVLAALDAAGHLAGSNTFAIWAGTSALDVVGSELCSSFGGSLAGTSGAESKLCARAVFAASMQLTPIASIRVVSVSKALTRSSR